ncbi:DUF1289 domain-containing protein [Paraglaciecola aquimarina]|uniref:DUF1289 domain-containing protein n=1 Tax=Paraglaciecola aquimarina TaxID=1235557 RepID=A0ABU3T0Y9_9ALTE|nr:DUF1289 domain-containing protein [Paraglaciecola aquimarina]MDU0355939.1 DUF1289 domain-containing protein [Paraglaciecola aquimarina]
MSPCIGNCCLDEKDMCLGCFRMLDDILQWSASADEQKQRVLDACEKRRLEHKSLYNKPY